MSGSSNIKQWNPGVNNQATDEEWLVDVLRTGGAPVGALFPSKTGNKLFFQLSTMAAALAQALADKGYDVSDDDLTALTAVMANIRTRDVGIRDSFRNLVATNNATHPTYQVDLTCDEAILENAAGQAVRVSGVSVTYDITTDLDGGSETNSVWYHMWLFGKADGSYTYKLSLDPAAPTAPAGYTYKAYAGAVYNNSSGDFKVFSQRGSKVGTIQTAIASAATYATWTKVDLSSAVPLTAKAIRGWVNCANTQDTGQTIITLSPDNTTFLDLSTHGGNVSSPSGATLKSQYHKLLRAQEIYYYLETATGTATVGIYLTGWEY